MVVQQQSGGGRVAVGAAALAVVLAVGGTGCSSATVADERPAADTVRAVPAALRHAADTLVRAGSSRVRTTVQTAAGGTRVSIRGSGVYDFCRRRGRLRLVLPDEANGAPEHPPITELLTSRALFLRNRGEGAPPDAWVRADTADISDGNLVSGGATDPWAAAELLRGTRRVTAVGTERLAGTTVRHYRGTADLRRAARAASPAVRGPLAAAARALADDHVPFDAYLDARGRLRMVRYRFLVRQVVGRRGGRGTAVVPRTVGVTSTARLYDFGVDAAVALPRPADVHTGRIGDPAGP